MAKKFMHIMVDDIMTNAESNELSESLSRLSDDYDIVISSNNLQITTFNQDAMQLMNDKLDIILENMNSLGSIRNDIRSDIKYVFGLTKDKTI